MAEGAMSAEEAMESAISSSTVPTLFAYGTLEQERISASSATANKLITAKVHKASADSKVGIGLRAVGSNVYISSIVDGGIFARTSLKTGQRVLSINNQDCQGMSTSEAVALIRSAPGAVTIVATNEMMPPIAGKQVAGISTSSESAHPKQDHTSPATKSSTTADENDDELDPATEAYLERNRQLVGYSRCVSPLTAIWFSLFAYLRGPIWLILGFLFTFIQIVICCRLFTNKKGT
jgi:hypothetical protein